MATVSPWLDPAQSRQTLCRVVFGYAIINLNLNAPSVFIISHERSGPLRQDPIDWRGLHLPGLPGLELPPAPACHQRSTLAATQIDIRNLPQDVVKLVKKEAALLARIDHPNIIRLQEAFETPDRKYCLVLEYAAGLNVLMQAVTWSRGCSSTARPSSRRRRCWSGCARCAWG